MTMRTRGRARISRSWLCGVIVPVEGDWAISFKIEDGGLRGDQNITNGRTTAVKNDVNVRSHRGLNGLHNWLWSSIDT